MIISILAVKHIIHTLLYFFNMWEPFYFIIMFINTKYESVISLKHSPVAALHLNTK